MEHTALTFGLDVPEVAVDGQTVEIRDNGTVIIKFWQIRERQENELFVDVAAAVRYFTVDDLKVLRKDIDDTIKKHETREP